ncbi:MAG: integrase [Crocinitomix sp.]|jgi:integrase
MITTSPIYNRRNSLNADGTAPVVIRITLNRVPNYYSTGIKIIPSHWDQNKERVKKNCPYWWEYNTRIEELLEKVDAYNAHCLAKQLTPSIKKLKEYLNGNDKRKGLINFIAEEISLRTTLASGTLRHHNSKLALLKEFTEDNPNMTLKDVDYSFLQAFENHLVTNNKAVNTRWAYHKFLKAYLNIAIKKELLQVNPYNNFKVATQESKRDYLTLEEIELLENLKLEPKFKSHQIVLDKFLFSCYTGLRISDLSELTIEKFTEEKKAVYLSLRMVKTVKIIDLPLHELFDGKSIPIYKKYKVLPGPFLFPAQADQKVNDMLKDIATLAGIKKNVTFHMSRHSFGSAIARIYGDVLLIKKLMGHTKVDTSMIYIHLSPSDIEEKLKRGKLK